VNSNYSHWMQACDEAPLTIAVQGHDKNGHIVEHLHELYKIK
jgi:hypothetical protein